MKPSRDYGTVERHFMFAASEMTKAEVAVMAELISASGYSGVAHRTQMDLAKRLKLSRRSVARAYSKFMQMDLMAVAGHGRVLLNPRYWFKGDGKTFAYREKDYLDAKAGKWVPERAVEPEEEQTERLAAE